MCYYFSKQSFSHFHSADLQCFAWHTNPADWQAMRKRAISRTYQSIYFVFLFAVSKDGHLFSSAFKNKAFCHLFALINNRRHFQLQ